MRLNVVCVFACVFESVHDSLVVGVLRAAALHVKVTPHAARVSVQRAREKDRGEEKHDYCPSGLELHSNPCIYIKAPPLPLHLPCSMLYS